MSKAKVISVLNHKGGVGKTTTTINLGGALRQKGYKVLLIDLDGQANLTESLRFSAELPQTIYGAMKGEYDLPIYEHKDGLSVVPSCLDLSAVETELINEAGRELILALGCGAQQVEHKMRMDLKAKQARKRKRPLNLRHRNATLVDIE